MNGDETAEPTWEMIMPDGGRMMPDDEWLKDWAYRLSIRKKFELDAARERHARLLRRERGRTIKRLRRAWLADGERRRLYSPESGFGAF